MALDEEYSGPRSNDIVDQKYDIVILDQKYSYCLPNPRTKKLLTIHN